MVSTFETLPNEILMIIFKYTGDVYSILQTFLGLNQRLNRILLDKRLHLFTDFLQINFRHDYYDSDIFQQVSQQLLTVSTTIDERTLSHLLQSLISFHIQQKYIQLGFYFQTTHEQFLTLRQQLTNKTTQKLDEELKSRFHSLHKNSPTIKSLNRMKSLILTEGARLECHDGELSGFNLTSAVNDLFLSHIQHIPSKESLLLNSLVELFQILIISNPSLVNNRAYVGNGGRVLEYFLIYTIHQLFPYGSLQPSVPVNVACYRAAIDLYLFVLQCQKQLLRNQCNISATLFMIFQTVRTPNKNVFIKMTQFEIFKLVMNEYLERSDHQARDNFHGWWFPTVLKHLMKDHRLDIIVYIHYHIGFQQFFTEFEQVREYVDLMTGNQVERQFLATILSDQSLDLLFPKHFLIFVLLKKKERTLIETVIRTFPSMIHQLDEEGNDPLLYISLKVSGCRHRIIEYLMKMGADLERRNLKGENFLDTLELPRNRKLWKKLMEHEILPIDT